MIKRNTHRGFLFFKLNKRFKGQQLREERRACSLARPALTDRFGWSWKLKVEIKVWFLPFFLTKITLPYIYLIPRHVHFLHQSACNITWVSLTELKHWIVITNMHPIFSTKKEKWLLVLANKSWSSAIS